MKAALIDTDILSLYFRDNQNVVEKFSRYLTQHDCINLSIITYYEILSGKCQNSCRFKIHKKVDINLIAELTGLSKQTLKNLKSHLTL